MKETPSEMSSRHYYAIRISEQRDELDTFSRAEIIYYLNYTLRFDLLHSSLFRQLHKPGP